MTLLGIFFGGVYETVIVALRSVSAADTREALRRELVLAMDRLTRELGAAYAVDAAEDQRCQFDARDIDGDGSDDPNINYHVSSGLQRTVGALTLTLVPDLTALDFDYLDATGATLTTPVGGGSLGAIRVVDITMTAARGTESVSLTAAADLRNR